MQYLVLRMRIHTRGWHAITHRNNIIKSTYATSTVSLQINYITITNIPTKISYINYIQLKRELVLVSRTKPD